MIKTPNKNSGKPFLQVCRSFSLSVQFELLVDKCFRKSVHCFDTLFTVDQNGDLDLGSGNHLNVDICFIQGLEHLGSNAGVGLHACTDDRNLGYVVGNFDLVGTEDVGRSLQYFICKVSTVSRNGKADVFGAITADRLEDDVDIDLLGRQQREDLESDTGLSGRPTTAIRTTSSSFATPLISNFSILVTSLTFVPGLCSRLEQTSRFTLYFFAISTERLCSTCAPQEASSSISSKEISLSFFAEGTRRGSAV